MATRLERRRRVEECDAAVAVSCNNGVANAAQSSSPSLFALQQLGAQSFNVVSSEQREENRKSQTQDQRSL